MSVLSSPHPSEHLLIPFAGCGAAAWLPSVQALPRENTRHLSQLLQGMKRVHTDEGATDTLSPPHERALARAQGLSRVETPDGAIPWAARDAAVQLQAGAGQAWAWITPCHWTMGHDHVTLTDPAALALHEDESRALLATMQPYFETDGITLHYLAPDRWLGEGEPFRELPTASLDRVLGRDVAAWLPGGHNARDLRRLQNEMQMLLYIHPLNDARAARHQLPVNSLWISGTGALPAGWVNTKNPLRAPRSLALAVLSDDWTNYSQAWAALDAGEVAQLLLRQRAGETVRLTLCGERNAHTFETRPPSVFTRISNLFSTQPIDQVLAQL